MGDMGGMMNPECFYCGHFQVEAFGQCCRFHKIVLPAVEGEQMVCKNWMKKNKPNKKIVGDQDGLVLLQGRARDGSVSPLARCVRAINRFLFGTLDLSNDEKNRKREKVQIDDFLAGLESGLLYVGDVSYGRVFKEKIEIVNLNKTHD
jgi:hypothetical protein